MDVSTVAQFINLLPDEVPYDPAIEYRLTHLERINEPAFRVSEHFEQRSSYLGADV